MRKLRPLDLVAGLGGLVLFVSLFLNWYGIESPSRDAGIPQAEFTIEFSAAATGWQTLSVIDLLLALIAFVAIAVPVVTALSRGPAKPVALAVIATAVTPFAVLLVLFRLLDDPFPGEVMGFAVSIGPSAGLWVALAGALIAAGGSFGALKDESTPGAVAPDVPRRPAPPATAA